jgi:hypothetical protein
VAALLSRGKLWRLMRALKASPLPGTVAEPNWPVIRKLSTRGAAYR